MRYSLARRCATPHQHRRLHFELESADLLILLFFIYLRVESPDRSLQSFLFMFYLGMMIHSLGLPGYAKKTNNLLLSVGLLASFIFVLFAGAILNLGHSASFDLVSGMGLAGLIYAVAFKSSGTLLSKVLSSRVAQFYGKISFSYYLLHILLVYVSLNLLLSHMSVATDLDYIFTIVVISTVVIIITTMISWVFSIFVEQPAINISRRLAKSMRVAAINKSADIK